MRNQRGEGKLGVILWLAIIGSGIFAAVRIVPAKVAVTELHDFADTQVQSAGTAMRLDEGHLLDTIVDKARELNLPLEKKQMKFEVGTNDVRLRMVHQVTVDLAVYEWVWNYDLTFTHLRM